jgi:PPM family protein phosphatase
LGFKLTVNSETDVGMKREKNQDAYLTNTDLGLYMVADGMGGHKGGEVASRIAVETIQEVIEHSAKSSDKYPPRELLQKAFSQASQNIYEASSRDLSLRGMGTTLVVTYFVDDTLYIGNVGDSRAYLYREGNMWQMTEDHSLIYEQIKAGLWSEFETAAFPAKNVITRSVGFEKKVECDIILRRPLVGDKVLMCSDGLAGLVSDQRIAEIVKEHPEKIAVQKLIEEANKSGGDDNITVMIVSVLGEEK